MRKPKTESPLKVLTDVQEDALFLLLQKTMSYGQAVEWVKAQAGIETSVSSLTRWWRRQCNQRLRAQVRNSIASSSAFDRVVDEAKLDERMAKALKQSFFEAKALGIDDTALDYATVALQANRERREDSKASRLLASERERDKLLALVADLQARLKATENEAGKARAADPKAVMQEVDRLLGRKPISASSSATELPKPEPPGAAGNAAAEPPRQGPVQEAAHA